MSKETLYFSHDCNARNDRKLINLRMQHGMNGIGIYWCLIEMLYEEGGYMPLEYERITFELRIEETVLRAVINDFDLFVLDGNKFHSKSVLDRLAIRMEKSEKARKSIMYRWGGGGDTNEIRPKNDSNTKKKIKEKKIIQQKNKFLDAILLTEGEVIKLKEKFNGKFDFALETLNNYKMTSGKKYNSDYHALIGWVAKRVEQDVKEGKQIW